MAGIRLSIGLGVIGIIVAEFFTSLRGLGGLIVLYGNQFATAKMFVPLIVIAILSVALTKTVVIVERRLTRWRQRASKRGSSAQGVGDPVAHEVDRQRELVALDMLGTTFFGR